MVISIHRAEEMMSALASSRVSRLWLLCVLGTLLAASEAPSEEVLLLLDESPPVAIGDRVYATWFKHVYAIDAHRKAVLWEADLGEHSHCGLTQVGNRLATILGRSKRLLWIGPTTGQVTGRWSLLNSLPATYKYVAFEAMLQVGSSLLALHSGGIVAFQRDGRNVVWGEGFIAPDPQGAVGVRDRVFVIGRARGYPPLQLLALDLADGHTLGSAVCGPAYKRTVGPVLCGDVAVVCAEGRLKGYNRHSLDLVWTSEPGSGGFTRPCASEQAQVVIAGSQGTFIRPRAHYVNGVVAAFDLRTGRRMWSKKLQRGVKGCVIMGDAVATASLRNFNISSRTRGEVACFSIRSGERRWYHRLDLEPVAGPILLGETVWIKCVDPGSIRPAQPGQPGYVEPGSYPLSCGEPPTPRDYYLVPIDVPSGLVHL